MSGSNFNTSEGSIHSDPPSDTQLLAPTQTQTQTQAFESYDFDESRPLIRAAGPAAVTAIQNTFTSGGIRIRTNISDNSQSQELAATQLATQDDGFIQGIPSFSPIPRRPFKESQSPSKLLSKINEEVDSTEQQPNDDAIGGSQYGDDEPESGSADRLQNLEKSKSSNYSTQTSDADLIDDTIIPGTQVSNRGSDIIIEGTPRDQDRRSAPQGFKPPLDLDDTQDIETSQSKDELIDTSPYPNSNLLNTPCHNTRVHGNQTDFISFPSSLNKPTQQIKSQDSRSLSQPSSGPAETQDIIGGGNSNKSQNRHSFKSLNSLIPLNRDIFGVSNQSKLQGQWSPIYNEDITLEEHDVLNGILNNRQGNGENKNLKSAYRDTETQESVYANPNYFNGVESTQALNKVNKRAWSAVEIDTQIVDHSEENVHQPQILQDLDSRTQNILLYSEKVSSKLDDDLNISVDQNQNLGNLPSNGSNQNPQFPETQAIERSAATQVIGKDFGSHTPDFLKYSGKIKNVVSNRRLTPSILNTDSQDSVGVIKRPRGKRKLILVSDDEGSSKLDEDSKSDSGKSETGQKKAERLNCKAQEESEHNISLHSPTRKKHKHDDEQENSYIREQDSLDVIPHWNRYNRDSDSMLPPSSPPNDSSLDHSPRSEKPILLSPLQYSMHSRSTSMTNHDERQVSVFSDDGHGHRGFPVSSQLEPPPINLHNSRHHISRIKSVWARFKNSYVPAQVLTRAFYENTNGLSGTPYDSLLAKEKVPVLFPDGSWSDVKFSDTIVLDLFPTDQVRYTHNKTPLYEIIEVFSSKTDYGQSLLDKYSGNVIKEIPSPRKHQLPKTHGRSRSRNSSKQEQFSSPIKDAQNTSRSSSVSSIKPSVSVIVEANNGGDYVLLQAVSKKRGSLNTAVLISDLYLTATLSTKHYKKKGHYQPSQQESPIPQGRRTFPNSSVILANSIPSLISTRRKTAKASEGKYYESSSSDEEKTHRFRRAKTEYDSSFETNESALLSVNTTNGGSRVPPPPKSAILDKLKTIHAGIFSGSIFTITHGDKADKSNKQSNIEQKIRAEGGVVLNNGFKEMLNINEKEFYLDWPKRRILAPQVSDLNLDLEANGSPRPKARNLQRSVPLANRGAHRVDGSTTVTAMDSESFIEESLISPMYRFAAVVANDATRTPKYLEALTLGFPCLSFQFIDDCLAERRLLSNWSDYLLSAGTSTVLGEVQRSLNILTFHSLWLEGKSLQIHFYSRKLLLDKIRAPIYIISDSSLRKTIFARATSDFPVVSGLLENKMSSRLANRSDSMVMRALLLLIGCKPGNVIVPTKASDVKADKEEGAIIVYTGKEQTESDKLSSSESKEVLEILTTGGSLNGRVLKYNREWVIQCIINQRLV